jgi:hypothetical protein
MKIEGSVALVSGANRGLGAAFCRTLLDRVPPRCTPRHATPRRSTMPVWFPSGSMSRPRRTSPRPLIAAAT